jgi:hypothetical protein
LALNQYPKAECVILSKDKKGFDPLVQHLTGERGFNVRRVSAQTDAFPASYSPRSRNDFERLVSLLIKEKAQPRKRKGLEGKIKSWFPTLPGKERDGLMKRLFDEGFVSETDKLLTFVSARLSGAVEAHFVNKWVAPHGWASLRSIVNGQRNPKVARVSGSAMESQCELKRPCPPACAPCTHPTNERRPLGWF